MIFALVFIRPSLYLCKRIVVTIRRLCRIYFTHIFFPICIYRGKLSLGEKRSGQILLYHCIQHQQNHTLVTLSTCVKAVLLLSRLREVLRRGVKLPKWIQIDQIEPTDDKDIKCDRLFKKSLWGLSLIIIKILST